MNVSRPAATAAVLLLAAAAGVFAWLLPARANDAIDDAALERTRKQVRMLDDLYKTAIVLVTTHYVEEGSDLSAGDAFQELFAAMKEKVWHEVRLLDATGDPIDDDNLPQDDFERSAIASLKNGDGYVDKVITKEGRGYLRAATPIPVVMEKCVMCHANYENVPKGQPIGALGYTVVIE